MAKRGMNVRTGVVSEGAAQSIPTTPSDARRSRSRSRPHHATPRRSHSHRRAGYGVVKQRPLPVERDELDAVCVSAVPYDVVLKLVLEPRESLHDHDGGSTHSVEPAIRVHD